MILSSREDNLPNVCSKRCCATPVISFTIGGIPEVILDRVDGRLIPPFDTAAMASTVTELLHADGATLALGSAARDRIVSAYHLDAQAKAYETLFEGMLAQTDFRLTQSRCDRTHTPKTICLPMTLHPQVEKTSIGLFLEQQTVILEQQTVIDETKKANERAHFELDRVRDVLGAAARDIVSSSSWRYTRRLRRGVPEPATETDASPADAASTVLSLLRSRSWELTAPLRLIARAIRGASRTLNPARTARKADGDRA